MICINWEGFPQYGARCVRALVQSLNGEKVVVVARRPEVPVKGMEDICGCPVVWVNENETRSIREICGEMPRFMSISGWFLPLYNRWRDEVRSAGGHVCCGSDNNYMLDTLRLDIPSFRIIIKSYIRKIIFNLKNRNKYDYFFVPGRKGRQLMRFYGVPDSRIVEGSYSADASLFTNGCPLAERKKEMIFVGRYVKIKNIARLIKAFIAANEKKEWRLSLYGSGPLDKELRAIDPNMTEKGVFFNDFLQPEELADKYRNARFFCLTSLRDHWGLVVHEAALSGCALILGNRVGSAKDLLGEQKDERSACSYKHFTNGFTFDAYDVDGMTAALKRAMDYSTQEYEEAQKVSLELAAQHTLEGFATAIRRMADGLI